MNAVIIWYGFNMLHGSLINAIEYYIKALESNPDIRLILLDSSNYDSLLNLIENRYQLDDLKWKNNILTMSTSALVKFKFNNVLVIDYTTIRKTRGLINASEIVVVSEHFTDKSEYMYNKDLCNVTYYGEMPFVYKDIQYNMKLLFDRFKPLDRVDSAIYVSAPRSHDNMKLSHVSEIPPFILDNINKKDKKVIYKTENHHDNLFEAFDEFVYYQSLTSWDCHPRMFLECAFYNKTIHYIANHGIKDGSYYRYNSVNESGLDNRWLSKDDEVIQKLI